MSEASPIDVGALFEADAVRVLTFAHRLVGNWADAEDVLQETFLKAHREAGGFDRRAAPSTWLFAIARNACMDRLRGRRIHSFASLEHLIARTSPETPVQAGWADTALRAERDWYVEAVREGCLLATLSYLTVDQRAAFVLRVLCELNVRDTAAVLGRSENAVRLLTHRARARLKAFMCRNCSVYDSAGECTCENLVGFSLSQGWVTPDDRRVSRVEAAASATRAATAIGEAARLAAVYRSLEEPRLDPDLAARIRSVLA